MTDDNLRDRLMGLLPEDEIIAPPVATLRRSATIRRRMRATTALVAGSLMTIGATVLAFQLSTSPGQSTVNPLSTPGSKAPSGRDAECGSAIEPDTNGSSVSATQSGNGVSVRGSLVSSSDATLHGPPTVLFLNDHDKIESVAPVQTLNDEIVTVSAGETRPVGPYRIDLPRTCSGDAVFNLASPYRAVLVYRTNGDPVSFG
jgi:hypothetical protein